MLLSHSWCVACKHCCLGEGPQALLTGLSCHLGPCCGAGWLSLSCGRAVLLSEHRSESRSSSAQIEELKPQEGQQEQQEQAPQQQDVAQQQQDAEQGIEQEGDAALQQKQFGGGKLQQVTLQLRQLPGLSGLVAADKADAVAAADHRSASESLSASTPNLTPGPQRRQPDADSE